MYKHKIQIILIISIFLLSSCAASNEAENETADSKPTIAPSEAIAKAEKLYKERANLDKVREALKILDQSRDINNRNFDVEWKFAQYSYFLGHNKTISDEEAEKVLKKGISAAKIAKRLDPNKPDGHFWYAAILGEQSKRNPLTVGVASIDDIRDSMQKVIEIDKNYQGASAYDALGQLEMGTRNVGGSTEKALEYSEKALELNGENSYIRLHLAEAYLAVDRKADAKKQLEYVLSMKPNPDFLPEYEESVAEAKKLLKEKF